MPERHLFDRLRQPAGLMLAVAVGLGAFVCSRRAAIGEPDPDITTIHAHRTIPPQPTERTCSLTARMVGGRTVEFTVADASIPGSYEPELVEYHFGDGASAAHSQTSVQYEYATDGTYDAWVRVLLQAAPDGASLAPDDSPSLICNRAGIHVGRPAPGTPTHISSLDPSISAPVMLQ